MTIREQIEALQAGLADWVTAYNVQLSVAASSADLQASLASDPTGLQGALLFISERQDEAGADAGVVWRSFRLAIARGHGWTGIRSENLTTESHVGAALLDVIEDARTALLNVDFGLGYEYKPRLQDVSMEDTGDAPVDLWVVEILCGSKLIYPEA
jgi:hypothetical protein